MRPLQGLVTGHLAQALLIQTQQMKLHVESALLEMEKILRANAINFAFLAALPALLLSLAAASEPLVPLSPLPSRLMQALDVCGRLSSQFHHEHGNWHPCHERRDGECRAVASHKTVLSWCNAGLTKDWLLLQSKGAEGRGRAAQTTRRMLLGQVKIAAVLWCFLVSQYCMMHIARLMVLLDELLACTVALFHALQLNV